MAVSYTDKIPGQNQWEYIYLTVGRLHFPCKHLLESLQTHIAFSRGRFSKSAIIK